MHPDDGWPRPGYGTAGTQMKIALIGSGNVATNLAHGIAQLPDASITQIISRNPSHARQLAERFGASAAHHLAGLSDDFDLCIIAVKDDAIERVSATLPIYSDRIFAHTSGSISRDVLSRHPNNGVFYPLQTLSKTRPLPWTEIPLFLTASDPQTLALLSALASKLGSPHEKISDHQRATLHLAAIFANNFTNAMYTIAHDILLQENLSFDALKPLIQETARKVQELEPALAQTGPAKRNDKKVMDAHLSALSKHPQWQEIYRRVSEEITGSCI